MCVFMSNVEGDRERSVVSQLCAKVLALHHVVVSTPSFDLFRSNASGVICFVLVSVNSSDFQQVPNLLSPSTGGNYVGKMDIITTNDGNGPNLGRSE